MGRTHTAYRAGGQQHQQMTSSGVWSDHQCPSRQPLGSLEVSSMSRVLYTFVQMAHLSGYVWAHCLTTHFRVNRVSQISVKNCM